MVGAHGTGRRYAVSSTERHEPRLNMRMATGMGKGCSPRRRRGGVGEDAAGTERRWSATGAHGEAKYPMRSRAPGQQSTTRSTWEEEERRGESEAQHEKELSSPEAVGDGKPTAAPKLVVAKTPP